VDKETFWVVWKFGEHGEISHTNQPKTKHVSIDSAITEAKRLASTNPGQKFTVCRVMVEGKAAIATAEYRSFE